MRNLFLFCTLPLFFIGCHQEPHSTSTRTTTSTTQEFCTHEIQTTLCTQCNPSLVAVFRAKGTYCEAHGFAKIACPVCDPSLKRKTLLTDTTQTDSQQELPPDGTPIRFASPDIAAQLGIVTAAVKEHPIHTLREVNAKLIYEPSLHAQVQPRAAGVVQQIHVRLGDSVSVGTRLATLRSAEIESNRARAKSAAATLALAKEELLRTQTLVAQGLASERDLRSAQLALDNAQAELDAQNASLKEVNSLGSGLDYPLLSPIAGVVSAQNLRIGNYVQTEDILFEIVNLSSLALQLEIPESALSLVSLGQPIAVAFDALPEQEFYATLDYLSPEIDPHTRHLYARASLKNPSQTLRANMLATARLLQEQRNIVSIPKEALYRLQDKTFVFVKKAPELYETRYISLKNSQQDSKLVAVSQGLRVGEEVVTVGGFLLKTELRKDSIGAGCCAEK